MRRHFLTRIWALFLTLGLALPAPAQALRMTEIREQENAGLEELKQALLSGTRDGPAAEQSRNNFVDLPAEWTPVRDRLILEIRAPDFPESYGLAQGSREIRVFHGTVRDLLPSIAAEGMKAFPENRLDGSRKKNPGIFVTPSPTRALAHVIENGPHDTYRRGDGGKRAAGAGTSPPVLLAIRMPIDELKRHPDAQRPTLLPEWVKEERGLSPERDTRVQAFLDRLGEEVQGLQEGREAGDFGVRFPLDGIPPQHIYVVDPETGIETPVSEIASGLEEGEPTGEEYWKAAGSLWRTLAKALERSPLSMNPAQRRAIQDNAGKIFSIGFGRMRNEEALRQDRDGSVSHGKLWADAEGRVLDRSDGAVYEIEFTMEFASQGGRLRVDRLIFDDFRILDEKSRDEARPRPERIPFPVFMLETVVEVNRRLAAASAAEPAGNRFADPHADLAFPPDDENPYRSPGAGGDRSGLEEGKTRMSRFGGLLSTGRESLLADLSEWGTGLREIPLGEEIRFEALGKGLSVVIPPGLTARVARLGARRVAYIPLKSPGMRVLIGALARAENDGADGQEPLLPVGQRALARQIQRAMADSTVEDLPGGPGVVLAERAIPAPRGAVPSAVPLAEWMESARRIPLAGGEVAMRLEPWETLRVPAGSRLKILVGITGKGAGALSIVEHVVNPGSFQEGRPVAIVREKEDAQPDEEYILPPPNAGAAAQGVSKRHARLVRKGESLEIEDLGSRNGTFLLERELNALLRGQNTPLHRSMADTVVSAEAPAAPSLGARGPARTAGLEEGLPEAAKEAARALLSHRGLPDARLEALERLGEMAEKHLSWEPAAAAYGKVFSEAALGHADPRFALDSIRARAVRNLELIPSPAWLDTLERVLREDPSEPVRWEAVLALSQLEYADAGQLGRAVALMEERAGEGEPSEKVQRLAADQLAVLRPRYERVETLWDQEAPTERRRSAMEEISREVADEGDLGASVSPLYSWIYRNGLSRENTSADLAIAMMGALVRDVEGPIPSVEQEGWGDALRVAFPYEPARPPHPTRAMEIAMLKELFTGLLDRGRFPGLGLDEAGRLRDSVWNAVARLDSAAGLEEREEERIVKAIVERLLPNGNLPGGMRLERRGDEFHGRMTGVVGTDGTIEELGPDGSGLMGSRPADLIKSGGGFPFGVQVVLEEGESARQYLALEDDWEPPLPDRLRRLLATAVAEANHRVNPEFPRAPLFSAWDTYWGDWAGIQNAITDLVQNRAITRLEVRPAAVQARIAGDGEPFDQLIGLREMGPGIGSVAVAREGDKLIVTLQSAAGLEELPAAWGEAVRGLSEFRDLFKRFEGFTGQSALTHPGEGTRPLFSSWVGRVITALERGDRNGAFVLMGRLADLYSDPEMTNFSLEQGRGLVLEGPDEELDVLLPFVPWGEQALEYIRDYFTLTREYRAQFRNWGWRIAGLPEVSAGLEETAVLGRLAVSAEGLFGITPPVAKPEAPPVVVAPLVPAAPAPALTAAGLEERTVQNRMVRTLFDLELVRAAVENARQGVRPDLLEGLQAAEAGHAEELARQRDELIRQIDLLERTETWLFWQVGALGAGARDNRSEVQTLRTTRTTLAGSRSLLAQAEAALGITAGLEEGGFERLAAYLAQKDVISFFQFHADFGDPVTDITADLENLAPMLKAAGFERGEAHLIRIGGEVVQPTKPIRVIIAGSDAETIDTIKKNIRQALPGTFEIVEKWDPTVDFVIADASFDAGRRREFLAQRKGMFLQADLPQVAAGITPAFLTTLLNDPKLFQPGSVLFLNGLVRGDFGEAILTFA